MNSEGEKLIIPSRTHARPFNKIILRETTVRPFKFTSLCTQQPSKSKEKTNNKKRVLSVDNAENQPSNGQITLSTEINQEKISKRTDVVNCEESIVTENFPRSKNVTKISSKTVKTSRENEIKLLENHTTNQETETTCVNGIYSREIKQIVGNEFDVIKTSSEVKTSEKDHLNVLPVASCDVDLDNSVEPKRNNVKQGMELRLNEAIPKKDSRYLKMPAEKNNIPLPEKPVDFAIAVHRVCEKINRQKYCKNGRSNDEKHILKQFQTTLNKNCEKQIEAFDSSYEWIEANEQWNELVFKIQAIDLENEKLEWRLTRQRESLVEAQEKKKKIAEINSYIFDWEKLCLKLKQSQNHRERQTKKR